MKMGEVVFEAAGLTKEFDGVTALRDVSLSVSGPSIVGLIGRNASGKTTLLRHVVGLQLPTRGSARTLGVPTHSLQHEQLARIGVVTQVPAFIHWMSVGRQLRYLSGFYPRWDLARQALLLDLLDLDAAAEIRGLSTGSVQKLAIVAALCHHPDLILLDEPVSNLDPIVRDRLLRLLLDLVQDDSATIVISSHVLHDIESTVNWIVCLNNGAVAADAALDDLKDQYAEWRVTARTRDLPDRYAESFVVRQAVTQPRAARLDVRTGDADLASFQRAHDADVEVAALNLQGLFPILVGDGRR
jgi:ABC-2 type transport system ATP-binding protein